MPNPFAQRAAMFAAMAAKRIGGPRIVRRLSKTFNPRFGSGTAAKIAARQSRMHEATQLLASQHAKASQKLGTLGAQQAELANRFYGVGPGKVQRLLGTTEKQAAKFASKKAAINKRFGQVSSQYGTQEREVGRLATAVRRVQPGQFTTGAKSAIMKQRRKAYRNIAIAGTGAVGAGAVAIARKRRRNQQ